MIERSNDRDWKGWYIGKSASLESRYRRKVVAGSTPVSSACDFGLWFISTIRSIRMVLTKFDHSYILKWARKIRASALLGNQCVGCGNSDIFVLEFHHLRDKEFELKDLRGKPWSVWEDEIVKCELLCGNCHYEKHHEPNRIKESILRLFDSRKCSQCEYNGTALEFHHHGKKNFNMGDVVGRKVNPTLSQLLREVDLCTLMCRNCHHREHADQQKFKRFEALIRDRVINMRERVADINQEEVWALLDSGFRKSQIAEKLNCAPSTVTRISKLRKEIVCD